MKGKKTQKKRYKLKSKKHNHSNEINGILILALGILILLSFYFKNSIGLFGIFIRDVSLGFLGFPSFLLPPVIILFAVFLIIKRGENHYKSRILYAAIMILLISAIIQTGYYKFEDYNNLKLLDSISKFYTDGTELQGGGVLGGLVSLPFLLTFKVLGTLVILTALSFVNIILLTNTSISQFIKNIKGLIIADKTDKSRKTKKIEYNNGDSETNVIPEIFGDEDNLSLEFAQKQKVIDFRIEKTVRELKEKTIKEQNEKTIRGLKEKSGNKKTDNNEIETPLLIDTAQHTNILSQYQYPPYTLLKQENDSGSSSKTYRNQVIEGAKKLEETLSSFGVSAKVINVTRGPTVTRYELQPSAGVKVSRIVNLSDDIALNLAASGVRIEAPIPGKAAIGIEVPNKELNLVLLREVLESEDFVKYPSKISFAIGKDISGECIIADIAKMPHLLIAGATGSGKSVCINSLIVSILYKATPDEVKLLMIDPKVVELGVYNSIPHLLIPVVTDPKKAAGALNWAVQEMVNRYKLFAEKSVRDLKGYNEIIKKESDQSPLPQIIIIIDELADLMMVAPNDVEDAICRLAQMARAAGMHLVIATQRPSVDVITGVIKANIPSRVSFAVSSQIDSRTILDMAGAEKLLGRGDMLFHPVGKPKPIRIQGANITDAEVEKVVDYIKSQCNVLYDDKIIEEINNSDSEYIKNDGDNDEILPNAIDLVIEMGQASVSLIQRKFKVGYARAARIVDQMEERGIVGGYEGSKPRQILISKQQWQELKMSEEE